MKVPGAGTCRILLGPHGPLATAAQGQEVRQALSVLHNKAWAFDHAPATYNALAERRENLLSQFPGNPALVRYSHQKTLCGKLQYKTSTLTPQHVFSTRYYRDANQDLLEVLTQKVLLKARPHHKARAGVYTALTSAEKFAERIVWSQPALQRLIDPDATRTEKISNGIFVTDFYCNTPANRDAFEKHFGDMFDHGIRELGARPQFEAVSNYLLHEATSFGPLNQAANQPAAKRTPVGSLLHNTRNNAFKQIHSPAAHYPDDVQLVVQLAAALTLTLLDRLEPHCNELPPLVQDCLRQIDNILIAMGQPLGSGNNASHSLGESLNLYNMLLSETSVVLDNLPATPNLLEQLNQHIESDYAQRLQSLSALNGVSVRSLGFASSGMDALVTAVWNALAECPPGTPINLNKHQHESHYFELDNLCKRLETDQDLLATWFSPVIVASLLPNMPSEESSGPAPTSFAKLQTHVDSTLKHHAQKASVVHLIVDTTLDLAPNVLDQLITTLKTPLEEGRLNLILAKSLQKYDALGTTRLMFGNITSIHKPSDKAERLSQRIASELREQDCLHTSNGNLLALVTDPALQPFKSIVANKALHACHFMTGFFWPVPHHENSRLPYIMALAHVAVKPNTLLIQQMQVPSRDSFGFLDSGFLRIGVTSDGWENHMFFRINPGIETKERLTEKFWAPSRIFLTNMPAADQTIFLMKLVQDLDAFLEAPPGSPEMERLCMNLCSHNGAAHHVFKYWPNMLASALLAAIPVDCSGPPMPAFAAEKLIAMAMTPSKVKTISPEARQELCGRWFMHAAQPLKPNSLQLGLAARFATPQSRLNTFVNLSDAGFKPSQTHHSKRQFMGLFTQGVEVPELIAVAKALLAVRHYAKADALVRHIEKKIKNRPWVEPPRRFDFLTSHFMAAPAPTTQNGGAEIAANLAELKQHIQQELT